MAFEYDVLDLSKKNIFGAIAIDLIFYVIILQS